MATSKQQQQFYDDVDDEHHVIDANVQPFLIIPPELHRNPSKLSITKSSVRNYPSHRYGTRCPTTPNSSLSSDDNDDDDGDSSSNVPTLAKNCRYPNKFSYSSEIRCKRRLKQKSSSNMKFSLSNAASLISRTPILWCTILFALLSCSSFSDDVRTLPLLLSVSAFNIDVKQPVIYNGNRSTLFGFTVLQHMDRGSKL